MLSVSHCFLPDRTNPPTRFSFPSISKSDLQFLQVRSASAFEEKQKPSPATKKDDSEGKLEVGTAISESFPAIKTAKRVVLVRHGQSTWNAEGRIIQGSFDFSVLTAKGESQAEISRQMLVDDLFDIFFLSPLKRSRRTTEIIWSTRKESILTDYDLRGIDLYSFQVYMHFFWCWSVLFIISCFGCIGASTQNGCCIGCVSY